MSTGNYRATDCTLGYLIKEYAVDHEVSEKDVEVTLTGIPRLIPYFD